MRVFDTSTWRQAVTIAGPRVRSLSFDPTSRRLAVGTYGGDATIWEIPSGVRVRRLREGGEPVDAIAFSRDGELVAAGRFIALSCRNHGTRVWDTARGELLASLPDVTPVEGDHYSAFPALTATGDRAAIARGNTVEVYALPRGQFLRTIAHPTAVNAVAFAPAGHDLVSGAADGSLLITRDGREPTALPTSPAGIDAVAILADGRAVAADASERLRVIDQDRSALLMDLAAPSRVRLLRPSPDGRRLITISTSEKQARRHCGILTVSSDVGTEGPHVRSSR